MADNINQGQFGNREDTESMASQGGKNMGREARKGGKKNRGRSSS